MLTEKAVWLYNIRAKRKRPGLQRQHLAAVNAAAKVCGANIRGAKHDSREFWFTPGEVQPADFEFAIGTAGSTTLVLQTVLPPLLVALGPARLEIAGGTHNPLAPPFDFLEQAYLPLVERMGPRVSLNLKRHGFYPRGGGSFCSTVQPVRKLAPLVLDERGELRRIRARALVAGLSPDIARRELAVVKERLGCDDDDDVEAVELDRRQGPGNVLLVTVESEHVTELFAGFGERGVRAQAVAERTVDEVQRYLESAAAVGEHLADQLLLPMAMAGGGSFTTLPLSSHATTNIAVIERFLDVKFAVEEVDERRVRVSATS
jgi:RNA 3'-terminal phosphate cyclase (ATP)